MRLLLLATMTMTALLSAGAGCRPKPPVRVAPPPPPPEVPVQTVSIPSPVSAVDFRVLFRSGSVNDPAGKEGLTALSARLMVEGGTKKHSYAELLDLLYPMAAAISVQVDKEVTVFTARVHRDHLKSFLPLLAEVLTEPRFDAQAFARLKTDALNQIRKGLRMEDDEQLSLEALDSWIYEGHPYGHLVEGTVRGLEAITAADVKQQAARVFTRDRLLLGLAGAVDAGVIERVKKALAALPARGAPAVKIPPPEPVTGIHVRIIEKDTDSTAITLGFPLAADRRGPDFHSLWLAQSTLGEHRQSTGRLYQAIREARGLNYGDYAYIEPYVEHGAVTKPVLNIGRQQNAFKVWIRPVQHPHKLFTVRLALHTLQQFIDQGCTEDELTRTKQFLAGYTRVFEETLDRRLGYALDDALYGLKQPFLEHARQVFQTLSAAQVNAAIKKHLQLKNVKMVIVTRDGAALKKLLSQHAPAVIKYDTPKPREVLAADKLIATFDPGLGSTPVEILPVELLFER